MLGFVKILWELRIITSTRNSLPEAEWDCKTDTGDEALRTWIMHPLQHSGWFSSVVPVAALTQRAGHCSSSMWAQLRCGWEM